MVAASKLAEKIFSLLVKSVNNQHKNEYTTLVNYEDCKLFIRPFVYREIIMVSGLWEPYVRQILEKDIKNDDILVDVGANIGTYAIPLAKKVKKVIAIEPHPKTSEILEMNIALNNLQNLELIKKVVGDSKRKVAYGLSDPPDESGIIYSANSKMQSVVETECVDLDSLLVVEQDINWLLIDVEGYESNVLIGARRTIRRCSPKIIIESYPENFKKVSEILHEEGYSVDQIHSIYYYAHKV